MEVVHRCRTFSIIANLNKLESFILHDPACQHLYQQYLSLAFPGERIANHIPFFADIVDLGERGNCSKASETFKAELYSVFEKYMVADSQFFLDIPNERLDQVRRNIHKDLTLAAFKPAIKVVVRDLAFVHMESFINSAIFKDFKDSADVDFNLPRTTVQEKDSTLKLRKFFGDKFLHTGSSIKLLGDQPKHIKEYKLSKLFGERVGVERVALLEDQHNEEHMAAHTRRRDRRLHIFFGDHFQVEDTLFSERIQASKSTIISKEFTKQPYHVNTFRLTKFFGERPPTEEDLFQFDSDGSGSGSDSDDDPMELVDDVSANKNIHSKTQHLVRFFGERIDPAKEANSVAFASQPEHVKACTLKKIFGESAAHTINFDGPSGGTWPRTKSLKSRAKLEKFFGPFEG